MPAYRTAAPGQRSGLAALVSAALLLFGIAVIFVPQISCGGSSDRKTVFAPPVFPPVDPLNSNEVAQIIDGASAAVDDDSLVVVVVDRIGRILGLWRRNPGTPLDQVNKGVAIARTGAFLSSSQGPLSSRTLEFISTHHFPATFAQPEAPPIVLQDNTITTLPEQRITTGVGFTPQGPLWQIFTTNRGAQLDDPTVVNLGPNSGTVPNGGYLVGQAYPLSGAYDPTAPASDFQSYPGPGLGYLPGGVPLFKAGRLVGAVGCYINTPFADPGNTDPIAAPSGLDLLKMEYAAVQGASAGIGFIFPASEAESGGFIYLVGILLPYLEQLALPAGASPGIAASADGGSEFLDVDSVTGGVQMTRPGMRDPFGWLVGPIQDPIATPNGQPGLSVAEVTSIINQGIDTANGARAAIRLPIGTPTKMILAISNIEGAMLGVFRMEDAPIFSLDVSCTKARNVIYFSSPEAVANGEYLDSNGNPIIDDFQGAPIAMTNRTIGFLTQPFYPPGIDTSAEVPGPLFQKLAVQTSIPANFDNQGAQTDPTFRKSGIVFFPGAAPLYRNNTLIAGFGVSGDGVEEDDFVTYGGVTKSIQDNGNIGFDVPTQLRADQYFHSDVRLPYLKFPQLPGGGDGP